MVCLGDTSCCVKSWQDHEREEEDEMGLRNQIESGVMSHTLCNEKRLITKKTFRVDVRFRSIAPLGSLSHFVDMSSLVKATCRNRLRRARTFPLYSWSDRISSSSHTDS